MKPNWKMLTIGLVIVGGGIALLASDTHLWLFGVGPRSMFHEWVGASHTTWARTMYFKDEAGTYVFVDEPLNIVVVLFLSKGNQTLPLSNCSPDKAVFIVNGTEHIVTEADANKLIVFQQGVGRESVDLDTEGGVAIRRSIFETNIIGAGPPVPLVDLVRAEYRGSDREALARILRKR